MNNFERMHKSRVASVVSSSYDKSCDHRDQPLFKLFRTLTTLLGAVGICICIGQSDSWYMKAFAYFRRLYAILIFIILCWSSFTSVLSWVSITKLDVIHTQAIMFTLWTMIACGSFFFLLYWQVRNRFVVHSQLLMEATGQAGIRRHKTLILSCGMVMAGWVVCATIFYPAVVIIQGDLLTFALSYGAMNFRKMYYVLIFAFCYGVFAWASAIGIFSFICLCDFLEFRHFNKSLRKLNVQENWEELYSHFDQYYKLLIAIDHCNRSFRLINERKIGNMRLQLTGFSSDEEFLCIVFYCIICFWAFALFSFGTAIPNAILIIYGLLINKMTSLDLALTLVSLAAMIIIFVFLTIIPAAINEQAAKSSKAVYKKIRPLDFSDSTQKVDFQRLNWFAMHAANRPVGISIGPFFLITYNLLLTMISLIITYLTLLPYNSVSDSQCSKNATIQF